MHLSRRPNHVSLLGLRGLRGRGLSAAFLALDRPLERRAQALQVLEGVREDGRMSSALGLASSGPSEICLMDNIRTPMQEISKFVRSIIFTNS